MVWGERVALVELLHCTVRYDAKGQEEIAEWLCANFPHLEHLNLHSISYLVALKTAKAHFQNIPRKLMRPSLVKFMAKYLDYLSPGVVLGVSDLDVFSHIL